MARDTSTQAAVSVRGKAATLRQQVYEHLHSKGRYGATDEEMQDALEMNPSTQRPRRKELETNNQITDSGQRRRTRSGRNAIVWVITGIDDSGQLRLV